MYKLKEREGEEKALNRVQLSSIFRFCPLNPHAQAQMNLGTSPYQEWLSNTPSSTVLRAHTHTHTHVQINRYR